MFGNYKDCQAWRDIGMPLNTTSNETSKMYDALMRQMNVKQEDSNLGGIEGTITKMFEADQDFILGHVFKLYMTIMEKPIGDKHIKEELDSLNSLVKSQWRELSDLEKGHVQVLQSLSKGQLEEGSFQLEDILTDYPKDTLAMKMFYGIQIMRSTFEQQRNVVARVLPYFNRKTDIEYGYLLGMHAFSLEETNFFDAAEKKAKEALDCDRHDAWATHSLAHVYDMTGRYIEGIDFMSDTRKDWEIIGSLKCHNNWHTALFYIEQGNMEGALKLYDEFVEPSIKLGMFQLSDAITMLYRLKMEGVNVSKERWRNLADEIDKRTPTHQFAYYDASLMLGLCSSDSHGKAESFLQSIKDIAESDDGTDIHHITKSVNQHLCEAICRYDTGEFDLAVEVLLPHRYKMATIGGSLAQRDVFNLLLLQSAIKSTKHQKLALQLVNERKYSKDTPLTHRLQSNIVLSHVH